MNTEQRLAALETSNRQLRIGICLIIIAFFAMASIASKKDVDHARITKELRAEKFVLVDSSNKERGVLAADKNGTNLVLMHEGTRVWLNTSNVVGSWIDLVQKNRANARLSVTPFGSSSFRLCDKSGQSRVDIRTTDQGKPNLELCDEKGTARVGLVLMEKSDGHVVLRGKDGKITLLP